MTNTQKKTAVQALVLGAVAAASYAIGVAQRRPVNLSANEIKWVPYAPGAPLQVAVLWGDREKGSEYGMLLKLPAGFEAGMHAHTADYHAINLQGVWIHTNEGDPLKRELGPGSYVMQPGKEFHDDGCKGPGDCILFVHQHAPGDFIPKPPSR